VGTASPPILPSPGHRIHSDLNSFSATDRMHSSSVTTSLRTIGGRQWRGDFDPAQAMESLRSTSARSHRTKGPMSDDREPPRTPSAAWFCTNTRSLFTYGATIARTIWDKRHAVYDALADCFPRADLPPLPFAGARQKRSPLKRRVAPDSPA